MRTVLFLAVLLLHGEQALCKPSRLAQLKRLLDPDGDVSGPIVKDSDLRRASASSSTPPPPPVAGGNSSIAALIDKALKHEFSDETATLTAEEATKPLNATAEIEEGTLETVIRISGKSRDAAEDVADAGGGGGGAGGRHNASRTGGAKSGHQQTGDDAQQLPSSLHTLTSADAVDRIIDNKNNVFILSRVGSDAVASLLVDPQLVQDITAVLATCAGFGILFEMIRQPVINGYLVAGAVLGPGGFGIIQELVQVESLSQVGVQLLLFNLGLELSMSKLRAVYGVAIFGGCIQILLSMLLTGSMAAFGGVSVSQGIFIGALLSMSSTSVVVKCLETTRSTNTLYGQITIGTLILQDCCVGLMFALLPVFRSETVAVNASLAAVQPAESRAAVVLMIFHVLFKLAAALALAAVVSKTVLVVVLRLLYRHGSSELVQLCLVAICLAASLVSHHYGISSELGAFIAGAMIAHAFIVSGLSGGVTPGGGSSLSGGGSSSGLLSSPQGGLGGGSLGVRGGDHHHHAHKEPHVLIESVHNVLTALFVASIGLMTSPTFLWDHITVLAAGALCVVLVKSLLITCVVRAFGIGLRTSFTIGITMAHIGEFSLVLLSMAMHFKILSVEVYMLLLGVTALSLLTTPMVIMVTHSLLRDRPETLLPLVVGRNLAKRPSSSGGTLTSPNASDGLRGVGLIDSPTNHLYHGVGGGASGGGAGGDGGGGDGGGEASPVWVDSGDAWRRKAPTRMGRAAFGD